MEKWNVGIVFVSQYLSQRNDTMEWEERKEFVLKCWF